MGIKSPDKIAVPSVRNDLAFLVTVTREWQQGVVHYDGGTRQEGEGDR